ncbi:MAG: hypothetical protein HEQ32_05850 [Vampirovibrio sp.]
MSSLRYYTQSICLVLAFIMSALPYAKANTEWWQEASTRALLPPTPKAPYVYSGLNLYQGSQRLYLAPLPKQADMATRVAVNPMLPSQKKSYTLVNVSPPPLALEGVSAIGVSKSWLSITSNPKLVQALAVMSESPEGADSLQKIQSHKGKVIFKNLSELSLQYSDFDALAWRDKQNNWMLFINQKHESAPIYALAALISHEALHSDTQNSKAEEAEAWGREARTWRYFTSKHPDLKSAALESFPLVQRLNRIVRALNEEDLHRMVVEHPSYASLPASSPFFTAQTTQPVQSLITRAQAPTLLNNRVIGTLPALSTAQNKALLIQASKKPEQASNIAMLATSSAVLPFKAPSLPALEQSVINQPLQGLRVEPLPYRQDALSAAAPTFIWEAPVPQAPE